MKFRTALIKLAATSTHHKYRHSAIVAKGKSILARGVNGNCWHAEVDALLTGQRKSFKGATMYTLMIRENGTLGNGTPCSECMSEIKDKGIRQVVVYV